MLKNLPEKKTEALLSCLKSYPGVFLETNHLDQENRTSFLFTKPYKTLIYNVGDDIKDFFSSIEKSLSAGHWVAGYFAYEFGYLFEERLLPLLKKKDIDFPLAWIGVFKKPLVLDHKDLFRQRQSAANGRNGFKMSQSRFSMGTAQYRSNLAKIKNYLAKGDTYQVNFTLKYKSRFSGRPQDLYLRLRRSQPTSYSGFINDGRRHILSFSPELFFRIDRNKITVRPMKGTFKRGKNPVEDSVNSQFLKQDAKNRAENIMIVDLLRNDLGKIARKGSVKTESFFDVEKYPSLLQMTSTVKARLKDKTPLLEIFRAIFPSGSVTGAPKIRTMQIIEELEARPRDVYTGAIGFISPKGQACFNVAIRTAVLSKGNLEFGVGGGIVYDSKPDKEYKECLLKADFITTRRQDFSLIETMLWQQGRFSLLKLHLKRLADSCGFFGIDLDQLKLLRQLKSLPQSLAPKRKYKVRILVGRNGRSAISRSPLKDIKGDVRLRLSRLKVDSNQLFLYHKTTQRSFYDKQRDKALRKGFFEVVFTNEKDELTEGAISNLFLLKNGKLLTPPLACGLLPGVLRQDLLVKGKAREARLHAEDIFKADKVFIGNSVRGLIEVKASNIKC